MGVAAEQASILVIRGGAIGDFILTLPVLAALRSAFPRTRLEVLGYPHIAQLATFGGLADEVRSIEAAALAGFFARDGRLDEALQTYFSGFAIIISYLYDPDCIFQSNIARCSKAQFIAGPHRPNENTALPATRAFLRPLERLAIFEADPVPRLPNETLCLERCSPSASLLLAVHPGSGSERKNWPEEKWAELLREIIRRASLQLLLVGGEAEGERLPRLTKVLPADRVQIAYNLPLPKLAERLAQCDCFVGHDSGIAHLAAAIGLPVLALWGDSTESVWRPQGEKVFILKNAFGLKELPVPEVLQGLDQLLSWTKSGD